MQAAGDERRAECEKSLTGQDTFGRQRRYARRVHRPAAAVVVALAHAPCAALSARGAATPRDRSAGRRVEHPPPGENGSVTFDRNTTDQAWLYDGLTALRGNVTPRDLRRFFKPAPLGLGADKPQQQERPRAGVTIVRDRFGVAHVTGKSERDVAFGAGWVTAADRGSPPAHPRPGPHRGARRARARSARPRALGRTFVPSAEADVPREPARRGPRAGADRQKILAIAGAYAAGINAWYREGHSGRGLHPERCRRVGCSHRCAVRRERWAGGPERDVPRRARGAAGRLRGSARVRRPLRLDPEAPVTVPGSFPYSCRHTSPPASSWTTELDGAPFEQPAFASNAVLVGAKRRRTPSLRSRPAGGYFFPVLRGDGARRRRHDAGAVQEPRSSSSAAAPTSRGVRPPRADNVDLFVETLCTDDRHYVYRGECQAMSRFFVGTLKTPGSPDQPVAYLQTTHGPVVGYATVGGKRVAISAQRSTRGRELLSSKAFYELNTGRVTSAQRFVQSMSSGRVQLQLVLFRRSRRRSSPAAVSHQLRAPIPRCRPRASATPTEGSCRSPASARDQPAFGADPQLEQQACGGRRVRGLELRVRSVPASSCYGTHSVRSESSRSQASPAR